MVGMYIPIYIFRYYIEMLPTPRSLYIYTHTFSFRSSLPPSLSLCLYLIHPFHTPKSVFRAEVADSQ